jgi:hypothetical protein
MQYKLVGFNITLLSINKLKFINISIKIAWNRKLERKFLPLTVV